MVPRSEALITIAAFIAVFLALAFFAPRQSTACVKIGGAMPIFGLCN